MSYSPPPSAKPFTLAIPDKDLQEWRQLLQLSKLGPTTYENTQSEQNFGVTQKWLSSTKDYWLNTYNWRAQESHINTLPNYRIPIEDIDLHFIGVFSSRKDAIPIIFMHGWPGSFIEFLPLLRVVQKQYPDAKDRPYHIVVPSLPGYTLSSSAGADKNWTVEDSARVMNTLMVQLGFDKYIAQGGDVGSFEARVMARDYKECVGMHLNMLSTPASDRPDPSTLSALEKRAIENADAWSTRGSAYAMEHATRPSTIGFVLSSNPLALLAWIGEKFLEWSDEDPVIDDILTNVSLYWFTGGFPRSIYPYRQLFGPGRPKMPKEAKPTGFSFFPKELSPGIKSALEKHCNLVSYVQHERGGHFAALERPEELWGDVKEFAGKVWKGPGAKL